MKAKYKGETYTEKFSEVTESCKYSTDPAFNPMNTFYAL
jgi:hypothetical protein